MTRKKVLYISTNDGSDMRINKEINTLASYADIYFLGVGEYGTKNYAKKKCKEFYLIEAKRNSFVAIRRHIMLFRRIIKKHNFDSVHIINEQLMIFFYPWLFRQHVVLDIFDSLFMKKNKPGNQWKWIKKIFYKPINIIFVTDTNRQNLMPDFVQNKLDVLENYPNRYHGIAQHNRVNELTIFYNGSMANGRGTKFLQDILDKFKDVKIIMAGWIADDNTKILSEYPHVDFRGVITQQEATRIAAMEADYIMCCYEPSNTNNINASPNKIYDAIQTHTPVIMNSEVKVSRFVKEKNIGIVLDSFYNYNIDMVYKELLSKKGKFNFSEENADLYSWESIENKLLKAHQLV